MKTKINNTKKYISLVDASLLLAVGWSALGGCRIEPRDERQPAVEHGLQTDSISPADSLREEGPPVPAGDTMRLLRSDAAVARPQRVDAPLVVASGLAIPVDGVRPEDLVNTFDDARGQGRDHDAIDILAPRGTAVFAATDGRILRLFTSERGGLTVYQLGADGHTVYYYAHLDAYAKGLKKGRKVQRGEVIGTVGDTGNAAPGNTHLHFAMWRVEDPAQFWDGEPINPYPLLSRSKYYTP